jgi:hypothetical protein
MTTPKPISPASGRTRLVTASAVVAVVVAGAFAIAANVGILQRSNDSGVGTLAAAGDLAPVDTRVVDVYLDGKNPGPAATLGSRTFTVGTAGTVTVSSAGGQVKVDEIAPSPGWTADVTEAAGASVTVTLTDGTQTLQFMAHAGTDGTISGDVSDVTASTASPNSHDAENQHDSHDDHHDGSHHDEGDGSDD